MPVMYHGVDQHRRQVKGPLTGRHEIREFVESCESARWYRVTVTEGMHILAGHINNRTWFSTVVPA